MLISALGPILSLVKGRPITTFEGHQSGWSCSEMPVTVTLPVLRAPLDLRGSGCYRLLRVV